MNIQTERGFTLIELMVAISLFMFVTGIVGYNWISGMVTNENNRNLFVAMNQVQQKMEEIKNYRTLETLDEIRTAYNGKTFQLSNFPTNRGSIEVLQVAGVPSGQLYRVSIEVSWRQQNGRITGEDANLNGALNVGEDANANGRLDSPAQAVSYVSP